MSGGGDRMTRTLATIAISLALVSVILSGYAVWLQSRSTDQLEDLSDSLRRAIEARPIRDTHYMPPPPELDDGVD